MRRRNFSLTMISAAVLAGCGGDDYSISSPSVPAPPGEPQTPGAPPPPPPPAPAGPELATPTALPAGTAFLQSIAATDGDGSRAPGQANIWDLSSDFSIFDGGNDQFDGALHLSVSVGGSPASFPSDQTYAELTALGPELAAGDGVKTVSFTSDAQFLLGAGSASGSYAYLHVGPEIRLQQTLNLTGASGGIALIWSGKSTFFAPSGPFYDPNQYVQVVVRDTAGALLATLFRTNFSGTTGTWGSAPLTAFMGQTVVLSFEQRAWSRDGIWGNTWGTVIDNVSVKDSINHEFVTNGDFEASNSGWTVSAAKVAQNVRSGVRTLKGLEVQRTFFTQPNQLWARTTDEFHNPTAAPINAVVTYETNLGSDRNGIIYPTPGAAQKALSAWDFKSNGGLIGDRDVGIAFGTADTVAYQSDTALGARQGADDLRFSFDISVPAGGTITLTNFVVMTGTDTGLTATDITARATQVDTQVADIANNFRTNNAYQRGLTQAQLDTLQNF